MTGQTHWSPPQLVRSFGEIGDEGEAWRGECSLLLAWLQPLCTVCDSFYSHFSAYNIMMQPYMHSVFNVYRLFASEYNAPHYYVTSIIKVTPFDSIVSYYRAFLCVSEDHEVTNPRYVSSINYCRLKLC